MTSRQSLGDVIFITKLETQNQGNQALSIAWRDRLEELYPAYVIRPLERSPNYLKRYTVVDISKKENVVAEFDKIAAKLCGRAKKSKITNPPIRKDIRHNSKISQAVRAVRLRRLLNIRSRLSVLGLGGKAYFERLALFRTAKMVVVNPAGEFYPGATDTALAYLLELRCAQLLGVRTAVVNLSFEVVDETLKKISTHVFDHCDVFQFRDFESLTEYKQAGGKRDPVVLPDGALMTKPPQPSSGSNGGAGIALAINALQVRSAGLERPWAEFIDRVVEQGFKPVLTSNEWTTDEPFWGQFIASGKAHSAGREADYRQYMDLLRTFDVVVSSRLHTCVLAIVAGVPVVPVETGTFKLTGFFRQIGLDLPIRLGSPDWQSAIIASIRRVQADPLAAVTAQNVCKNDALNRLNSGIDALFNGVLKE